MGKAGRWKAEGIRSSALEFVAYSLGFFHDSHRAASDCRATVRRRDQARILPGFDWIRTFRSARMGSKIEPMRGFRIDPS